MKIEVALLLLLAGCMGRDSQPRVDFVYFNLWTNEIKVVVHGIPPSASPGILVPVHDENDSLNAKSSTLFETVTLETEIKIQWEENGTSHEVGFKRSELELPAKMSRGEVRFTYLGNDKWRIKLPGRQ